MTPPEDSLFDYRRELDECIDEIHRLQAENERLRKMLKRSGIELVMCKTDYVGLVKEIEAVLAEASEK